ncbi:MAG: hypothetical protein R3E79_51345 [Caldilineaceae bacterium]
MPPVAAAVFETAPASGRTELHGTLIVGTDGHDWLQGADGPDLILGLGGPADDLGAAMATMSSVAALGGHHPGPAWQRHPLRR